MGREKKMGRGLEKTFFQRHKIWSKTYEKVLNITHHYGNTTQNHKLSTYT